MLAAQAAGADGRARDDHERLPGAGPRAAGRARRRRRSACTTRGARREPGRAPRPAGVLAAADVRRPGADPPRRRDPPRLGRPGGGRGLRLDLRLDRARPHARLRAAAGRRASATRRTFRTIFAADEVLHVLEGVLVHRRPGDRRGAARRDRARACSSAATPGTTRSRSGPSRCACSSSSRRRPPRAPRAPTRARSRTSRPRATRTTRCSAHWPPARRRRRSGCACCAPADVLCRRDLGVLVRRPGQHRAPDGRDARDRAGRGGRPCTRTAATRC